MPAGRTWFSRRPGMPIAGRPGSRPSPVFRRSWAGETTRPDARTTGAPSRSAGLRLRRSTGIRFRSGRGSCCAGIGRLDRRGEAGEGALRSPRIRRLRGDRAEEGSTSVARRSSAWSGTRQETADDPEGPPLGPAVDRLIAWTLALAAGLPRLWALDLRPLHHDEGSNAIFPVASGARGDLSIRSRQITTGRPSTTSAPGHCGSWGRARCAAPRAGAPGDRARPARLGAAARDRPAGSGRRGAVRRLLALVRLLLARRDPRDWFSCS